MATYSDPVRLPYRPKTPCDCALCKKGEPHQTEHYYCRVYDGGRRTWRNTKEVKLELAKERKKTWEFRDAKGERHVEDLGFEEAAKKWLEAKETRVSDGCYRVYRTYHDHWLRHFRKTPLRSIEPDLVEKFFTKRKKTGVKARTLNDERTQLRSLFAFAILNGWIVRDPSRIVGRFREEKRRPRSLDEAEDLRFLEECRGVGGNTFPFCLALLRAGFRGRTVRQLEWDHVDFARREWRIPAKIMKSREDFTGRPIEPELMEWLEANRKPAGLIFGRLQIEKFRAARKRAALDWLRPHDCRRTFVTRCRRRGVPMEITMWLSDHRDIKVVLDCYREVRPEEGRDAIVKAFGGAAIADWEKKALTAGWKPPKRWGKKNPGPAVDSTSEAG
jgi:integrase